MWSESQEKPGYFQLSFRLPEKIEVDGLSFEMYLAKEIPGGGGHAKASGATISAEQFKLLKRGELGSVRVKKEVSIEKRTLKNAFLAVIATIKPWNFIKQLVLGRWERSSGLSAKTYIKAAFRGDENRIKEEIRRITKTGLNGIGVNFIDEAEAKNRVVKGEFEEFTSSDRKALFVVVGGEKLKVWVENLNPGVMIYIAKPASVKDEVQAFHELVNNVATDTPNTGNSFSEQLIEFGNLPIDKKAGEQQLYPEILDIGNESGLIEGVSEDKYAKVYKEAGTLVVSGTDENLVKNKRVDLTLGENESIESRLESVGRAFRTKSLTSVMQKIRLTIALNVEEQSIKEPNLLNYLSGLKNNKYSGSANMSNARFDDKTAPKVTKAQLDKIRKELNIKIARNYVCDSMEQFVGLEKEVTKVLTTYDDVYIDLSKLESLSSNDFAGWFAGFSVEMRSKYPESKFYITMPKGLVGTQVESAVRGIQNFAVNPLVIEREEQLKGINSTVTDVVIKSDSDLLNDVRIGDKIRDMLGLEVKPEKPLEYGDRIGLNMFGKGNKDIAGQSKGIKEDVFVQMCQAAVMCYTDSNVLGKIEGMLSDKVFNSGELQRAKQDLERCIERYKAIDESKEPAEKKDELDRIRGEFAGVVKAVLSEKFSLSEQVKFVNEQDGSEFLLLMVVAGASAKEDVRKIPGLIADGKALKISDKLNERIDKERLTAKTVINLRPISISEAEVISLNDDKTVNGLTLEDLIYILALNKKPEAFESLKENMMPSFNTATLVAIKAAG